MMCGQHAVVTDAFEAARQRMLQKSPDEGVDEQHDRALATVSVVARANPHLLVISGENAFVRDCDPMGIACEVVEYLGRTARRGFGIDHPVMGEQRAVALLPRGGARFGIIRNLAGAPGRFECVEKLATEYARGRLYRKEEAAATARGLPLPRLIEPATVMSACT